MRVPDKFYGLRPWPAWPISLAMAIVGFALMGQIFGIERGSE